MSKISHEAWQAARLEWECSPALTLQAIATKLGVALPTVSIRAKKESWMKMLPEAQSVEQAAADVLGQLSGRQELVAAVGTALDLSVQTRVLVINRQRDDWLAHRRLFTTEAMASDPVCAKRAKLAAEALAIRQRGEAIAYGIVTMTGASTDAPLVEQVDEAKERPQWELLLESYATTGKAPDWALKSTYKVQAEPKLDALGFEIEDAQETRTPFPGATPPPSPENGS